MPTSKPTKGQLEMMALLREYHWKVWVPDSELTNARLGVGGRQGRRRHDKPGTATSAQVHAVRRFCFRLTARGLVEYAQDGLSGYSFRLTRAAREVLR